MSNKLSILFFTALFFSFSLTSYAGNVLDSDWDDVVDGKCNDQNSAWWSSSEAIRIAENVLLYQKDIGGWPKNTDMHLVLSQTTKDKLIAAKPGNSGCTIDNDAVLLELKYLSKVYAALPDGATKSNIKEGFLKGVQYLLVAQYDNGGWPQFFPFRSSTSYSNHITYNDDAMIHVLNILRHIYQKDSEYSIIVADSTITKVKTAFDKGVDCIINTQYVQQGLLTSWCAQHHYSTLEPVMARSYELASLSGSEAAEIIKFLMTIDSPSYEIRRAIYHAVNWYDDARIVGYKLEGYTNSDGKDDIRVVADANASDMWGRFNSLEDNIPFFCSRDGIKKYSIAEISYERRNNYGWYSNRGHGVFSDYNQWYSNWGSNTEQETIILSPFADVTYLSNDSISVKANANEYKFGCIKKFELFVDGILIKDFGSAKINSYLTNLSEGTHKIVVKSTDDIAYSTSDSCSINVITGFRLTVTNGFGGGGFRENTKVNIWADTTELGQKFEKWIGDTIYLTNVYDASTTVTIPAKDIVLTAVYKTLPTYSLRINSGSGDGKYYNGAEVKITADTPPVGKVFEKWIGDTIYLADVYDASTTVTIPEGNISLTAVYIDKLTDVYESFSKTQQLKVYPNPTKSSFSIDLGAIGDSKIEIYNLTGKLAYSTYSVNSVQLISAHNLTPGIYIIRLTDSMKNIYTQKLMIE